MGVFSVLEGVFSENGWIGLLNTCVSFSETVPSI